MMTPSECEDVRQLVYRELASIEDRIAHQAGSYRFLCLLGGGPVFTHTRCGPVLRVLR
jgi:hypothetical protein